MLNLFKIIRENSFLNRHKKIIKFCVSGTVSAGVDFGTLILLVEVFSFNIIAANTISFTLAVINSFMFNKHWTFRDAGKNYSKQFFKFFMVSVTGLILNNSFLYLFIKLGLWYVAGKVITTLIVLFWNFSVNNLWTFDNQSKQHQHEERN